LAWRIISATSSSPSRDCECGFAIRRSNASTIAFYPLFIVRTGYRKYKIIAREPILPTRNAASRDVVIADAMQNWARVLDEVVSYYWPQ
jgi:hypothetical protein